MRLALVSSVVAVGTIISAAFILPTIITAQEETGADSSVYCPNLTRLLILGSRDERTAGEVSELQRFLSDYYDLNPDEYVTGYFGRLTRDNVRRFQCEKMGICSGSESSNGWGLVGRRTREAIAASCDGTVSNLPPGDYEGDQVLLAVDPAIRVSTPNGGEVWRVGGSGTVSWRSAYAPAEAYVGRISLYKGAVFLIDLIPFLSTYPATGSLQWPISPNSVTGNDFRIQTILYRGAAGNESVIASDWSDAPFTITNQENVDMPVSCTLTSDKNTYLYGETIRFTWTSRNATYAEFVQQNDGRDHLWVPGDKLGANGTQPVTANVIGNPYVTIRVGNAYHTATCTRIVSVVSGPEIGVPNIRLSSPLGGTYSSGSVIPIRWSSDSAPTGSGVALWVGQPGYAPGGGGVGLVGSALLNPFGPGVPATLLPATGSYNWTVPNGWPSEYYAIQAYLLTGGSAVGCTTGSCVLANNTSGTFQIGSGSWSSGSCTFNGQMIENGGSVVAYQAYSTPTYPVQTRCVPETRYCTNGVLSGSYPLSTCTNSYGDSASANQTQLANALSALEGALQKLLELLR